MVAIRGGAVSYERGTPVQTAREEMAEERVLLEQARRDGNLRSVGDEEVYLCFVVRLSPAAAAR